MSCAPAQWGSLAFDLLKPQHQVGESQENTVEL